MSRLNTSRTLLIATMAGVAIAITLVALILLSREDRSGDSSSVAAAPTNAAPVANDAPMLVAAAEPVEVPSPEQVPLTPEQRALVAQNQQAMLGMISAHRSLRTEAVSDPDSPENRAILQSMIIKALAPRSEDIPPTN